MLSNTLSLFFCSFSFFFSSIYTDCILSAQFHHGIHIMVWIWLMTYWKKTSHFYKWFRISHSYVQNFSSTLFANNLGGQFWRQQQLQHCNGKKLNTLSSNIFLLYLTNINRDYIKQFFLSLSVESSIRFRSSRICAKCQRNTRDFFLCWITFLPFQSRCTKRIFEKPQHFKAFKTLNDMAIIDIKKKSFHMRNIKSFFC